MNRTLSILITLIILGGASLQSHGSSAPQLPEKGQTPSSVGSSTASQAPAAPPLTQKEVIDLLKSKQQRAQAPAIVEQRGVDFELNPEIEKALRKAKADDQFIGIVKNAGPAARAARTAAQGGLNIPPEESRELQAIQNELDPDRAIQLASDYEQKHPNSPGLTYAYSLAANAYQQKGDIEKVLANGKKSLELKNDNLLSLLIMGSMLPQPQSLKTGDPEKKLAQAEAYASQALKLIDALPKQPNETDEQYKAKKAQLSREPYSALGMVHLERAQQALEGPDRGELAAAEKEFQTAVSVTPQPAPQDYYRLGEIRIMLKNYDGAMEAFTKASELGQGTVIKTYADERIQAIQKLKAQAPAPK